MPNVHLTARAPTRVWLVLAGLLLVALNLRIAVAAVAPVLPDIRSDLGLSRGVAGLLTTLPVVCFGVLAPAAAYFGRRLGSELAIFVSMLALVSGIALRSVDGVSLLLTGTVLIGGSIAIGNVLVPSLIKQDLPHLTGLATGLYTVALTGGAALAAAFTAPLAHGDGGGWEGVGWRGALALGAVPAVLAGVLWAPQLGRRHVPPGASSNRRGWVWREPLAWELAVFMGSQSWLFYSVLAWLPEMLQERGVSPTNAGLALSAFNLVGILGALTLPSLAARHRDQRGYAAFTGAAWLIGMAGLWVLPDLYAVWSVVLGFAQGAGISMAMTLLVLRAAHPSAARELSGMVQTAGYLLAAAGPFVIGALRDRTGDWGVSIGVLVLWTAVMLAAGFASGRPRQVGGRAEA